MEAVSGEDGFPWLSTFTTDDILIEEREEMPSEPAIPPAIAGLFVGGATAYTAKELEEQKTKDNG